MILPFGKEPTLTRTRQVDIDAVHAAQKNGSIGISCAPFPWDSRDSALSHNSVDLAVGLGQLVCMREWGQHAKHNKAKRAGGASVAHSLPFHGVLLVVEEQIAQQSRDMHRISTGPIGDLANSGCALRE
ncbi:hypothetical protein QTH89_26935 [Variovorax sp. J22G21]|uniref:hypothetical protein n=1 Tax=Variovorax fucosicus TaxID=3053517 RepID=UPI00257496B1|nr:hypothetical protein [Variovorax sp. J22G21]MDM0042818.1 hypothetical protein [Variovorax sp. J22R193]MDM0064875.1 hypothetical protein [Variovorax sp. J22G21]